MLKTLALLFSLVILSSSSFSPEEENLFKNVEELLQSHLIEGQRWGMKYHTYRPDAKNYGPYQWLWDSAFHMIAWSRINITNSILDMRTMLQLQSRNTYKIPQMIYWGRKRIGDVFLNDISSLDRKVTQITQMPNLAFALERIYQQTQNKTLVQQFLPRLIEFHEWWKTHRQPDGDGKIVIIHPWQSGLDESPMYDQAFLADKIHPTPYKWNARNYQLMFTYTFIYKWNMDKILQKRKQPPNKYWMNYFVVKQVGVNAVYTYGWKIYERLSLEIGNKKMAEYCSKQYQHFLKGLLSLYDPELKRYTSEYLYKDEYKRTKANTIQVLFPLLIQDLPKEHKDGIISMLKDEKHYNSKFPIPTVSRSDPTYQPQLPKIYLMWRGPSWAAPNYFVLRGLRNHNQIQLHNQIAQKWEEQALNFGIWQMWNPETGKGEGAKGLGMSACIVDIIFYLRN